MPAELNPRYSIPRNRGIVTPTFVNLRVPKGLLTGRVAVNQAEWPSLQQIVVVGVADEVGGRSDMEL